MNQRRTSGLLDYVEGAVYHVFAKSGLSPWSLNSETIPPRATSLATFWPRFIVHLNHSPAPCSAGFVLSLNKDRVADTVEICT